MIRKFELFVTPFGEKRRIYMHLPNDYDESFERYPVVYMYDGHNLFEDETATYGKSWGLEPFLNSYDKPLIVVGIECSHRGHERLNEYCPYDLSVWGKNITGKGGLFMDWLVHECKPFIDRHFRTMPFRECTAIGGSSMGGLMAYYSAMRYNNYFSKAACLSPSLMICREALLREFQNVNISPDTRFYFSFGENEIRDPYPLLAPFEEDIRRRGARYLTEVIAGGNHNEATWETRNPIYMDFLWK